MNVIVWFIIYFYYRFFFFFLWLVFFIISDSDGFSWFYVKQKLIKVGYEFFVKKWYLYFGFNRKDYLVILMFNFVIFYLCDVDCFGIRYDGVSCVEDSFWNFDDGIQVIFRDGIGWYKIDRFVICRFSYVVEFYSY